MSVNSINYFGYQNRVGVEPDGSPVYFDPRKVKKNNTHIYVKPFDPRKDKVFIDPKTGEYTTWEPGLAFPEKENPTNKAAKALGVGIALALALVFRKPLKNVLVKTLKKTLPSAKNILSKGIEYTRKALKFAKPYVSKVVENVKPFVEKAVKFAKPLVTKTVNFVKNSIIEPILKYAKV